MRLDKLEIGKDAIVASVDSDDAALYQHILDMGLTPGTEVTMASAEGSGSGLPTASRRTSSSRMSRASRGPKRTTRVPWT